MAGGTILAPKIQKSHEPRAKSPCFSHKTLPIHPKTSPNLPSESVGVKPAMSNRWAVANAHGSFRKIQGLRGFPRRPFCLCKLTSRHSVYT